MTNKVKKIGVRTSITLNILVLVVIIWGLMGGVFGLVNSSIIKPLHERWVSQFELLDIQSTDTVFLGDSLTEGGKWSELLPQSSVRNRGIAGDTTEGVIERLKQITKGQPAQVFLMIGINDLALRVPREDIVSNIVTIINTIQKDSPETEIFVQSILPARKQFRERIISLNGALEKAVDGKAKWVNLYPLFLDDEGGFMKSSLTNDGAHMLGEGYIIWKDAIADFVNKNE